MGQEEARLYALAVAEAGLEVSEIAARVSGFIEQVGEMDSLRSALSHLGEAELSLGHVEASLMLLAATPPSDYSGNGEGA